jgi:hypothetical protein
MKQSTKYILAPLVVIFVLLFVALGYKVLSSYDSNIKVYKVSPKIELTRKQPRPTPAPVLVKNELGINVAYCEKGLNQLAVEVGLDENGMYVVKIRCAKKYEVNN